MSPSGWGEILGWCRFGWRLFVAVVTNEELAGFADVGRDSGEAGCGFVRDGDGILLEPAEAEGYGLTDPSDAYLYITLQISGFHFLSAFGTIHGAFSFSFYISEL